MKNIRPKKKFNIKKGDNIKIITGNHKGKTGEITNIDTQNDRVYVNGITLKKHTKPTAKNPKGGIIDIPASIHISNVGLIDSKTKKVTKVGRKLDKDGKLQRYSKSTKQFI